MLVVGFSTAALDAQESIEQRLRRIESMSPAERQRLDENFSRYKSLSESEREHYRRLHEEIQREPRLKEVLQQYDHWLKSLSENDRAKIREEKNPQRRQELVARMYAEAQQAQSREPMPEQEPERRRPSGRPPSDSSRPAPLSPPDLAAVMEVIERNLVESQDLPASEREQLQRERESIRYFLLLERLTRAERGFTPQLVEQAIEAIGNTAQRSQLETLPPDARRTGLKRLLAFNVVARVSRELEDTDRPREFLDRLGAGLDERERQHWNEQISRQRPPEIRRWLADRLQRHLDIPPFMEGHEPPPGRPPRFGRPGPPPRGNRPPPPE